MLKPSPDQQQELFRSRILQTESDENYESTIEEIYQKFDEDFEGVIIDRMVEQINSILNFPVGLNEIYDDMKKNNSISFDQIIALHDMGIPMIGVLQNLLGEVPELKIQLMARLGELKFRHFQLAIEELTKTDGFLGTSTKQKKKR